MDPKQFHRRVWALVVLLCLMLGGMGSTLYDLQINQGTDFYEQSQRKIAETQVVDASRGQILDRNGQVLVSNKSVYQVTLNTKLMGDDRNDVLLKLVRVAREEGVEWTDSLPISKTAPFTFTTDTPYYTVSKDEEGNDVTNTSRLCRLSLKMEWVQPPKEEDQEEVKEPGFFDKLAAFFTGKDPYEGLNEPVKKPTEADILPTAEVLLGRMCKSFNIHGENGWIDPKSLPKDADQNELLPVLNIGDMAPEDARAVAGILYELYLRTREVYHNPYIFATDVDIDFITRVKELSLPGVVIEPTTIRQYNTPYAAHLLGRVEQIWKEEWKDYKDIDEDGDGKPDYQMDDFVGKTGVELAFESYLRGKPGVRAVERNTNGKIVSSKWIEPPEPGDNVFLTLDIGLQQKVEDTLAQKIPQLESKEVEGAACVILDVKNADVLASASYPTYNPATFRQDYKELEKDPLRPMTNRALQGLYAPGSTFKPVTAIAGLEEGIITPSTTMDTKGVYTYYPDYKPKCWIYREHHRTHGTINVSQAIDVSCNYFFFDVGRRLGIDRIADYAARFGLGQRTGLELGEAKGVMAGPEFTESLGGTWYEGNTLSVAIGQESSQFTPIQLANYVATLVNGGTHNATHLLKEVKSNDFTKVLETYEPRVLSTVDIHPENLNAVKMGMLSLTTDGSVKKAFDALGVKVGAKTGTAQVNSKKEGNALFICFAPYDDPEIAMALVVEYGAHGSHMGPIAADILSYYFSSQQTQEVLPQENTIIR